MTDQRNLILAIVLSVGIILAFQLLYEQPRIEQQRERDAQIAEQQEQQQRSDGTTTPTPSVTPGQSSGDSSSINVPGSAGGDLNRADALEESPRLRIDNGRLHGSVALDGARFDDLTLADYHLTVNPTSPEIELLNPSDSRRAYFAEFGWVDAAGGAAMPDSQSVWQSDGGSLGVGSPVTMTWDNGEGLSFEKLVSLDENYMFTVDRTVTNTTNSAVTLYPYSLLSRRGTPDTMGFYILHEGPIGVFNETLEEIDYSDLQEDGAVEFSSNGGWIGFTDKYWLAALIPDQSANIKATFRHSIQDADDRYQVDFLGDPQTIPAGSSITLTDRLFAGAKEVDKLDAYGAEYNIPLFDRAVDFGWFYFLTKPIFYMLVWFYGIVGNYGIAILLLTLAVKLVFFPLANKSYKAMSQMKKLQPEMQKLRERYGDDKQKMQQELMALYKKEKVNPMAGCLPIIIQIPVFFALYKVLFVSIEMRHAPFFGWIQDLSAPDPTTIFNLFGLIPWDPPSLLMIGVWPLLMGITMFLQQKLNPQPADPMQAKIMMMLPVMFVFLFATFPAGLVIYWTWNNVLSIAQQWVIMKRMGVPT